MNKTEEICEMPTNLLLKLATFIFLIQCSSCVARRSDSIKATYIPRLKYQNYDCEKIQRKLIYINDRARKISKIQDNLVVTDVAALSLGVVFHPILFSLISNGGRKEELSILKGEFDALESSAIEKQCTDINEEIKKQKIAYEEAKKRNQKVDEEEYK